MSVTPIRPNAPQRVNVTSYGAVSTFAAGYVDRPNIEAAAREGYLDALARKGFSRYYDAAPGPWQRNYEIGRLWATGMICCHIDPPDWPEGMTRQPATIDNALATISRQIGALRPEIEGIKAPDPDLPVLHMPMRIARRRRTR